MRFFYGNIPSIFPFTKPKNINRLKISIIKLIKQINIETRNLIKDFLHSFIDARIIRKKVSIYTRIIGISTPKAILGLIHFVARMEMFIK